MPAVTTILAATAAAAALAGTAYQIKSSSDARSDAEAQAKKQNDQQNALMQEAKDKQSSDLAQSAMTQLVARQRAGAASGAGPQGTLLGGVSGSAPGVSAGKTLLGQ